MYARLVTFNIGPGQRDMATGMADEAFAMVKPMKGFVSATYFIIDEGAGEYGSVTTWQSRADAAAAGEILLPWMMQKVGDKLTAPPVSRHAEVYEPR